MNRIVTIDNNSAEIQHLRKRDKRLSKVIDMVGPIEYYIHDDPYEFIIHEIIEQMLSIKAGRRIFERLNSICSGSITVKTLEQLCDDEIKSCGMSGAKVSYIRALNKAIISNDLDLSALPDLTDDQVIEELTKIKGIGSWTAKMYLIFVLNRPDILPIEDGAFLQSYRWLYKTSDCSASSIKKKCAKWKPYSSIAARYLYRALDAGLTKSEFHLFKEV